MANVFKKILKGVLIGGGTVLSLLCPPAGGAVITAGMAIGAGAAAAGTLIKTDKPTPTVDTVTGKINDTLSAWGLMAPADYETTQGTSKSFIISPIMWAIAGLGALFLIFRRR